MAAPVLLRAATGGSQAVSVVVVVVAPLASIRFNCNFCTPSPT